MEHYSNNYTKNAKLGAGVLLTALNQSSQALLIHDCSQKGAIRQKAVFITETADPGMAS